MSMLTLIAAKWFRMSSDERRDEIAKTFTSPSVNDVDRELIRRNNDALEILIDHAERTA